MEEIRPAVFMSYKSEDEEIVKWATDFLESKGIPCWYAKRNILLGQEYNKEILKTLKACGPVLVFITKNTALSEHIQKEIDLAIRYKRKVFSIFIDETPLPPNVEYFLTNLQSISKSAYDSDEEFLDYLAIFLEQLYQQEVMSPSSDSDQKKPLVLGSDTHFNVYEISSYELEKARKLFVPPPHMNIALEKLREQHMLLIHNPHHTGKYTYALSLLREMGIEEIYEWSKEISFPKLTKQMIKPKSGFIVEISNHEEFYEGMTDLVINQYAEKLKKSNIYFILIDKREGPFSMDSYQLKAHSVKNYQDLLLNHVQFSNQENKMKEKIIEWINENANEEQLFNQLYPRDANIYINKIEKLILGNITEEEFSLSMDNNVKERVKSWFKTNMTSPEYMRNLSFYLSLTLYEGSSYALIYEKAEHLYSFLMKNGTLTSSEDNILYERDDYLNLFHAHIVKEWRSTNIGSEETDIVRFIFKEDIPVIWSYIWEQYPLYNQLLMQWIRDSLSNSNQVTKDNIRNILIHILVKYPNSRTEIIIPLANSNLPKERLFAVWILEAISEDENRKYMLFKLMKSWATLKNNSRLQWTAITLLGTGVGKAYYPQSLRLLRSIYESNNGKNAIPVQLALENLSEHAMNDSNYEKIFIRFWIEWLKEQEEQNLYKVLPFAISIFTKKPDLLFYASSRETVLFFSTIVQYSMRKVQTRPLLEKLLETWAFASHNPKTDDPDFLGTDKYVSFLYGILQKEQQQNRNFLKKFIDKRVNTHLEIYAPIKTKLLTIIHNS